jgi:hypothetical protein
MNNRVYVSLEDARYADQKILYVEVNGRELVRQFVNRSDQDALQKWIDLMVICGITRRKRTDDP